ncbi:MAG: hypothetical protein K2O39_05095 [Clostridiales bacterium]|nr:hypothetical protein [Clostridiales bacterium]
MKKLRLMSMLVFVPIVLGIGLLIGGSLTDNQTAASIGGWVLSAGIPITMFVLVVVGLVLMITGKLDLSDDKKSSDGVSPVGNEQPDDDEDEWVDIGNDEDEPKDVVGGEDSISGDEKKKEYKQLSDINTSRGYDSKIKEAEYMARHTSDAYKNSSAKEKVFGWLFFGFLITDFFMIMVFAFIRIFVGAIVCFCLFGGTILLAILITVIRQKISMSWGMRKRKKREILDGVVKLCTVSSTTSTGSRTVRINKVVYKVVITAGENEYTAYTEDYHDKGESIKFWKIGRSLAMIMNEDRLEMLAKLEDSLARREELDDEPLD